MIGGEDKDGVVKPRFVTHLLEIAADGIVSIADGLVNRYLTTGKGRLMLVGNTVRIVTGGGEDSEEEGLALMSYLIAFLGKVLKIGLVENGPSAVEIPVVSIFVHAIIVFKADGIGKALETEGGIGCTMEEGGGIALLTEHRGQTLKGIGGIDVIAVRLNIAGDASKGGGHTINGTGAIGESVLKAVALGKQRIEEGRVTLIRHSVLVAVEKTYILS